VFIINSNTNILNFAKYYFLNLTNNTFVPLSVGIGTGVSMGAPVTANQVSLIDGNIFESLAVGINLGPGVSGVNIGHGNSYLMTTVPVVNAVTSSYLSAVNVLSSGFYGQLAIASAASDGGLIQFTTTQPIPVGTLVSGMYVWCSVPAATSPGWYPVRYIDSTHFDLEHSVFLATGTGICFNIP
jgi:hypothetical protein